MQGMKNMCPCPHHKVVPVAIVLVGVTFLLGNWNILTWNAVNTIWPILVIVGGLTKLTSNKCKCC